MRIGTDSNLKSIFLVNIGQRAFNLPKAHSTGFLAALTIVKTTLHRLMSRTDTPLDSKVLMDTQDPLTNSLVFFLVQERDKKMLVKVNF